MIISDNNKLFLYSVSALILAYLGTIYLSDWIHSKWFLFRIPRNNLINHRQSIGHLHKNLLENDEIDDQSMFVSEDAKKLSAIVHDMADFHAKSKAIKHYGVYCTSCRKEIRYGPRYLCTQCPDINICQSCQENNLHVSSHPLYVLPHHLPDSLVAYRLPTSHIPWQSPQNIELSRITELEEFTKFNDYRDLRIETKGLGQLDRLLARTAAKGVFTKFLHLIDKTRPSRPHYYNSFSEIEGVMTYSMFQSLLPFSIGDGQDFISYLMAKFYDLDDDGCINFRDFYHAQILIIKRPIMEQINRFLYVCNKEIGFEQSAIRLKELFQDLFSYYIESNKINFRKAMNLLTFDKDKYFKNPKKVLPKFTKNGQDLDRNDHLIALLMRPRIEIDPSMEFDPDSTVLKYDSQLSLQWHAAVHELVDDLFEGIDSDLTVKDIDQALFDRFSENEIFRDWMFSIFQYLLI